MLRHLIQNELPSIPYVTFRVSTKNLQFNKLRTLSCNFFSIAWKHGSLAQPTIIEGEHLSSFVWDPEDLDDDSLSDAQERLYGLDPLSNEGIQGRLGDFDGDGWSNFWELQRGTDPSVRNPFPKRSRSELFPEVADAVTQTLNNWSLTKIGRLNQHDASNKTRALCTLQPPAKTSLISPTLTTSSARPLRSRRRFNIHTLRIPTQMRALKFVILWLIGQPITTYPAPDGRISARMRPERVKLT